MTHDVLVIGGGTNGLAAAALLGAGGKRVVLCEARSALGGLAAAEEFGDGRRAPGVLHDTGEVSEAVLESLDLSRFGLVVEKGRPPVLLLEEDGPGVVLSGDVERTAAEIERRSSRDAAGWRELRAFLDRIAPFLDAVLTDAPPDVADTGLQALLAAGKKAVTLRRLGKRDMLEVLRVAPMCAADFVREWFETDLLQTGLALSAVASTWLGPWSAGSALNLVVREHRARSRVVGGASALAEALASAARSAHVELRTEAPVEELLLERGRVVGARLASGEELRAGVVLATCDPRQTLLHRMPRGAVGEPLRRRIAAFRARGTTGVVRLALSRPLEFAGRPGERIEHARTTGTIDDLERAFDAVKYRRASERPFLEIHSPADGPQPVASLLVHYAPYELGGELEGGWTDGRAEELADRAVAELVRFAPGVEGSVVAREVLTPAHLERRYVTTGGHLHHGEHALDQLLLRPTPETSRYATPFPGLFLGGSGSHPGGGLTCEPGRLAAEAILARG